MRTVDPCSSPCPGPPERARPVPPLAGPALCLVAALTLAGCQDAEEVETAEYHVFGTQVEVRFRGADTDTAGRATEALGRDFQRMHDNWHPWQSGELTRLNRDLADGEWTEAPEDLLELLEYSQEMERRSGGRFNAALGKLSALWGFHTSEFPITDPPPDSDDIDSIIGWRPSTLDIAVDGQRLRSDNRRVQLDFSGIGKGKAALRACDVLADHNISDALVNLGGDVMICGPAETPWQVGIRDPEGGVLGTLEAGQRSAIFTSGHDQRYAEWEGERYPHILNPFTGRPVEEALQATVIADDPMLADAAATALVVSGSEQWEAVAAAMGADQVLVVTEDGDIRASEAAGYLIEAAEAGEEED